MSKAVVVLSGGQDSTACLFWAKKRYEQVHAITFDYGQKHRIEIDAAIIIAEMADCNSHEIITLQNLKGRSPLTNDKEELETYKDFNEMDKVIGNRVELTFVPGRNTIFLSYAMNRAIAMDVYDVVTGVCQEDNANYPDCREDYIDSLENAFNKSLGFDVADADRHLAIVTPILNHSKAETVRMSINLPGCWEALAYSHTAYDGAYPPVGKDHASVLRAHGFEEAGHPDPLVVRAWHEGLMELPETKNYAYLRKMYMYKDGKVSIFPGDHLKEALDFSKIRN